MKKIQTRYLWIAALLVYGTACKKNTGDAGSKEKETSKINATVDHVEEMRTFIEDISAYARQQKPGFLIVPQDGLPLLTNTGDTTGLPDTAYLNAIDGVGQEEVYYGYDNADDVATPSGARNAYLRMLRLAERNGKQALVTDYCYTPLKVTNSYTNNFNNGFISYVATSRELDNIAITTPHNVHAGNVNTLNDAKNFLYLINPHTYSSKSAFVKKLDSTNFDVLILDGFFNDDSEPLTYNDLQLLKTKANGGRRLVLAYVAIGHAEDYRAYWNPDWFTNPPAWLDIAEDEDWEGNYMVRYWMPEWKSIVYGNDTSYIKRFTNVGFDGAYLDLYDYEYWETHD
ncbi:endo alpha-1,4 polygalactosaminidase [Longitalea luteola]|uniref:endo alpha-1,4 polygalactosaminidase n=1 Tax=Longitalea luteola TaxID=2812563 RepID=UPI001A9762B1|nr:endo alpha-1,4 polygalactosaminidase [Longitalea luteola]